MNPLKMPQHSSVRRGQFHPLKVRAAQKWLDPVSVFPATDWPDSTGGEDIDEDDELGYSCDLLFAPIVRQKKRNVLLIEGHESSTDKHTERLRSEK